MFDLLAVAGPPGRGAAWRPDERGVFAAEDEEGVIRGSLSEPAVTAVWLERAGRTDGRATGGGRVLFVVGDVWYRTDTAAYRSGRLQPSAADLLHRLDESSGACLAEVKGAFTLALVDTGSGACELVNCRTGIAPFYYAVDGGRLLFSTSLASLVRRLPRPPELDPAAVAELELFNYPIGGRTWARGVRMLMPGEIVSWSGGDARARRWWTPATLYEQPVLPRAEALDHGAELFHRVANDMTSDVDRVRVSFTSGFDSRTIVAVLDRDPADLMTYAFGIRGSLNVAIPEAICARLGIPFTPLYLGRDYEDVFDEYAFAALALSDALATVERANYPYAFERLAAFSPVVLTGLFGSELLRTFQNVGHLVSPAFVRLNEAADVRSALDALDPGRGNRSYFAPAFVAAGYEGVIADVEAFRAATASLPRERRFYVFLLQEGLRSYFGAEVHTERPWGRNRYPFLDDEFVELAFRAPFTGVHGRHLAPGVTERFRSQYFYAYVIRRYRPELLPFSTDHGYPPADVLSSLWPLKVGPKFLARRHRKRTTGYREFRTEEWTEALYRRRLLASPAPARWFSESLRRDLESGAWKASRVAFAKAASLKLWLDMEGWS